MLARPCNRAAKKVGSAEETKMRRVLSIAFAGALLAMPALSSVRADYPDRPIRLIVGFGPGGATDTFARIFSGPLAKALNQTVLVENVPGASGYIGWRTVASATSRRLHADDGGERAGHPPWFQGHQAAVRPDHRVHADRIRRDLAARRVRRQRGAGEFDAGTDRALRIRRRRS